MAPVDQRLLGALLGLRIDTRFAAVVEWLQKSLADNDHNMRRMTGDALTRAQGESLCIEHMLEVIGNADKLLKR